MDTTQMIEIDGRLGEGGGQVMRSSLSLSAALGVPVRVVNVRAGRSKPGLLRQHLTALKATAEICGGELQGAALGSTEFELHPGTVRAGEYRFAIGSAGSSMLVFQTVLPPLLLADGESWLTVEGGTHNPWAPPFEAVERSFAPLVEKMGAGLDSALERPGFYPSGGGRATFQIRPFDPPTPLTLLERGPEKKRRAEIWLCHLPQAIGRREYEALVPKLPWAEGKTEIVTRNDSPGSGNLVHITLSCEHVTEVETSFGRKGRRAEDVAKSAGIRAAKYWAHGAPVGEYLCDQLMVPLALGAG
ncbi:MAG: RNA 3'-terminal phosphate cyclase, partial [Planctomycetota bacterium]